MKKVISILLAALAALSLTACAVKPADTQTADIPDALTLLDTVWAQYAEDEKFPAAGGDYSEANMTDGAPGKIGLANLSDAEYLISLPASVLEQATDAASLMHMMNTNSFTCGVVRLSDAASATAAAAEAKTAILSKQWICGFPDKLVVATLGEYLISVYGLNDLLDTFCAKLQTVYPQTVMVSEDPIA